MTNVEQHFPKVEQVLERTVIGDVTLEVIFNPVDGRRVQLSCKDPSKMADLVKPIDEATGVAPIARRVAS